MVSQDGRGRPRSVEGEYGTEIVSYLWLESVPRAALGGDRQPQKTGGELPAKPGVPLRVADGEEVSPRRSMGAIRGRNQ